MKREYWIIIFILLIALLLGYFYFWKIESIRCEFGGNESNCNTFCKIDSDCKFEIGHCININESIYLPDGKMPRYEELSCGCENDKCVGNSTGRAII